MTAPAGTPSLPDRVPAETIRRLRLFYRLEREAFAEMFRVSVRTVFRWERDGVDPDALQLDPSAHPSSGPEWRRKLLIWLIENFQKSGVTDNRRTGECHP